MPRVSGVEVATRARALVNGRPFLLVATTALGSLEDRTGDGRWLGSISIWSSRSMPRRCGPSSTGSGRSAARQRQSSGARPTPLLSDLRARFPRYGGKTTRAGSDPRPVRVPAAFTSRPEKPSKPTQTSCSSHTRRSAGEEVSSSPPPVRPGRHVPSNPQAGRARLVCIARLFRWYMTMIRFLLATTFALVLAINGAAADDKKENPAGPVVLTVVAKTDKYKFDGGGKTAAEYKKDLEATAKALEDGGPATPAPSAGSGWTSYSRSLNTQQGSGHDLCRRKSEHSHVRVVRRSRCGDDEEPCGIPGNLHTAQGRDAGTGQVARDSGQASG